jgi:acyl-CoA reductase-like NAD-dependent aldehyde dehydrogenase
MAGNSIVLKPSEQSPLSAMMLARICADELPPGLVNIVTGFGEEVGTALVKHRDIRRVAFIGSVRTGRRIQEVAAQAGVKHVSLELGGKNPMIVFPDASPTEAAAAAVNGMNFAWQGQSCGSVSRLFLHRDIFDDCVDRVRELVSSLRLGDPMAELTDMGALNSRAQLDKVEYYVGSARSEGAKVLVGGNRPAGTEFDRGYWYEPTVFVDVDPSMEIFTDEIFGPVLSIIAWDDYPSLIEMVNSVKYGLTAAIWTNDLAKALSAAQDVEAGYVWINGVSTHFPACGFGGVKNSGLGREEGLDELKSYSEGKFIHVVDYRMAEAK